MGRVSKIAAVRPGTVQRRGVTLPSIVTMMICRIVNEGMRGKGGKDDENQK
jgi:hypothetical protein